MKVTFPSRFATHCYCQSCRVTHASGVVTWIGFKRSPGFMSKCGTACSSGANDTVSIAARHR